MKKISEGKAVILVHEGRISKKLPIFYNPVMKFNRDLSLVLLKSLKRPGLRIADPLAGSGVRSLRFLKELPKNQIKEIHINDIKKDFLKIVKLNLGKNRLKLSKKIKLSSQDANLFLLKNRPFDYIDIDPFGTPNPFLDSAVKNINKNGILAVTATDTSALCGAYENACKRKYWAKPLHDCRMHEIGLRILVRKIQLVAGQYKKAVYPLLCYSKEHYMRAFFCCEQGKSKVDEILSKHKFFETDAGPIWSGRLSNSSIINEMITSTKDKEILKFLQLLREEEIGLVGFYDIHWLAKKHKLKELPKKRDILFLLKKLGFKAVETHFSGSGIRSDISLSKLVKILKKNNKN